MKYLNTYYVTFKNLMKHFFPKNVNKYESPDDLFGGLVRRLIL